MVVRTHLVTFATPEFNVSASELRASAYLHGVDVVRVWTTADIHRTDFYRKNHVVLDHDRGAGYWLWKPYIVLEGLKAASDGDVVIYADAGMTLVGSVSPLVRLCVESGGVTLFAGPYDGVGGQVQRCGVWSKRDCFVLMGCDTDAFHQARMLDASFILFKKNRRGMRLVREWLTLCADARILTDSPNVCGLENLPGFLGHRHDQSVLSLLAERDGVELFRAPSQYGNHCKSTECRESGEWLRAPYGSSEVYSNSPYPSILFHHRRRLLQLAPFLYGLGDSVRVLCVGRDGAGANRATRHGMSRGQIIVTAAGGRDGDTESRDSATILPCQVVIFENGGAANMVRDVNSVLERELVNRERFVLCWNDLEAGIDGWVSFRTVQGILRERLGGHQLVFRYGVMEAIGTARPYRIVGIATGGASGATGGPRPPAA
jgi:hypothetical protein